ncbi:hypothetical protein GJ697_18790 [Pseudoduganella sp. FT25W]|uniref:Curli production assembly/transport component CsgG n=1 Tax=Duganella alba TaxID=2666081 RepID=A0A6L5QJG9_9BURK|nr:CsgG/HfaB family protein [Duganella alba]MRX09889.1 hypothetical protein [Duganella alba]MRX17526.1 hypothetical protein [Duganella alba]
MRTNVLSISFAIFLLAPALCMADASQVSERAIDVPRCSSPAAKVVFTEFKCKSADCSGGGTQQDPREYRWWERSGNVSQPRYTGVGTGMTEMLATALTQTGCFDVQERAELDEINRELALVGKKVEADAADYMITGSITSLGFEQSSTGLGGANFLRGPLGFLAGAVDFKKSKVHMNMDIRVVDIRRARIIASRTFQANNEKNGFGISALGWGGGTVLGGSHASISGSPLEEVARDLLVRSTSFLTETIAARNISEHVMVNATDVSAK